MKRSTILLLIGVVFLSFGYTREKKQTDISRIYLVDNLLIRTTPGEDIRLYDIATPTAVSELGKIDIEGNSDVAVSGKYMFANRNYDLMVYDISNPSSPQLVDSVQKVFSTIYTDVWNDWGEWEGGMEDEVVGGSSGCGGIGLGCGNNDVVNEPSTGSAESGADASNGQGGSLTRFMVIDNYLYCVDQSEIKVFDIGDASRPRYLNTVPVSWGIETIFHDGEHIFIGGQQGMYVYNITNPSSPTRVSEFTHASSCDPVVVEGNRAYVTLRGGTRCNGYTNQLDILDISTITNPKLLKSVPMDGPYGLAVRNGTVMVCDGASGVKTVDTENLNAISQCVAFSGHTVHDLIWHNNTVIITAEDGFYIYDATDPCHLKEYGRLF